MRLYGKYECFVMQMLYVCVLCLVAVLNAAFCMTFSLLMLVEDAIGDHMEEAYSRAGHTRAENPVLSSSILYCVLKTRTLRMYPSRTAIA